MIEVADDDRSLRGLGHGERFEVPVPGSTQENYGKLWKLKMFETIFGRIFLGKQRRSASAPYASDLFFESERIWKCH